MASIAKEKNGHRRILFVAPDGKRKTIRLGKVSQRNAEAVKVRVEQLLAAKLTGHVLESDAAKWVASLDPALADKLARVGLVDKPTFAEATELEPFITAFVDGRVDLKPATKIVRRQVIRDLAEFFGPNCSVAHINAGHADDFKQELLRKGLATTTVQKRLQVSRSFFNAMLRRKLISENPFDGVNVVAVGIKDRQRFVSREETEHLLVACPGPPLADYRGPRSVRRLANTERDAFCTLGRR